MESLAIEDLTLLLIEPSNTQAKIIRDQLHDEGVEKVDWVASGNDAMAQLEHYAPDLVVSSMYLPDMTAVELLTRLRTEPRYQSLPFMLVSSETRLSELEPVRQAGVVAILPKPFDRNDLHRALMATLQYLEPSEIELENYDVEQLRVLVVDDSRLARRHIVRVLNDMGLDNIAEAEDGHQAVQLLAEQKFDLVVTDYNMPHMDGMALTQFIREQLDNPFLPIIMVTSEQNQTRLGAVQQAGVSAICDKPFEPENVKEILYHCLEAQV